MIKPGCWTVAPRILIVDDEKTIRLILRRILHKDGYQVIEANNGEQCLEICQKQLADMVLLDAMMPQMDGFTCCAKLHQLLGENSPPVLMITVLDDQASVDLAFQVGATDYITKPIHWAVLRQRVRRLLQTQWAMRELRRQIEKERMLSEKLEKANQELERLASLDSLTMIANRRNFEKFIESEWKRSHKNGLPLSIIMCDVDFFKAYNDTYGHQAGDTCLKKIADLIVQNVNRSPDLVARYGGEEFVVVLPETDLQGAVYVAEKICKSIKDAAIVHQGSKISNCVTVSCGVATRTSLSWNTDFNSQPSDLIKEADSALYEAKSQGRNRVYSYSIN
ncbi:PleD family two-component system response regulator [Okeania sp. SIO1I7]|uniref:GGDEF domain-containing response regulator n=1 Tax=Okeania sp. SIO1I7 TaxID=2607772 RepID=UPI0013FA2147|nr:PleD family two-component system response regulator [Okeania sp. SIO1I7]NET27358.1 PleD family two-component system response regulator [Okeania sp. SIO1I7]